jgi:hypothetical protein
MFHNDEPDLGQGQWQTPKLKVKHVICDRYFAVANKGLYSVMTVLQQSLFTDYATIVIVDDRIDYAWNEYSTFVDALVQTKLQLAYYTTLFGIQVVPFQMPLNQQIIRRQQRQKQQQPQNGTGTGTQERFFDFIDFAGLGAEELEQETRWILDWLANESIYDHTWSDIFRFIQQQLPAVEDSIYFHTAKYRHLCWFGMNSNNISSTDDFKQLNCFCKH